MKRLKTVLFGSIWMIYPLLIPSQPIRVSLDEYITDEAFHKNQAMIPVFHYTGKPIEGIQEFGLKQVRNKSQVSFDVVFPLGMNPENDTGYTFIYYSGNTKSEPLGYVFGIVENYAGIGGPTLLWLDRNFNLDLNDDGPPDTFSNASKDYIFIRIKHPEISFSDYFVRLSRFQNSSNQKYIDLLQSHYQKNSGNKQFAGVRFSFREQRLNIKSGWYNDGTDSFRISVRDQNYNGLYDDVDMDELVLNTYDSREAGDYPFTVNKVTYIHWKLQSYKVIYIDPSGRYMDIEKDTSWLHYKGLSYCQKLPDFHIQFADKDQKRVNFRKWGRKKPCLVYFFSLNHETLADDLELLKIIHSQRHPYVKILAINYGDPMIKVLGWSHIQKVPFDVAIAPRELAQKYFIHNLPTLIITNSNGRMCEIIVDSQEIKLKLNHIVNP